MAASVAGRSAFLCAASRATTRTASSTLRGAVPASPRPSGCPNFTLPRTRISPPPLSSRFMRRELSSLLPVHSAIASARLVSKLPSEVNFSTEGHGGRQVKTSFSSMAGHNWEESIDVISLCAAKAFWSSN